MERSNSGVLSRSRAKTVTNGSGQHSEDESSDEEHTHGTSDTCTHHRNNHHLHLHSLIWVPFPNCFFKVWEFCKFVSVQVDSYLCVLCEAGLPVLSPSVSSHFSSSALCEDALPDSDSACLCDFIPSLTVPLALFKQTVWFALAGTTRHRSQSISQVKGKWNSPLFQNSTALHATT